MFDLSRYMETSVKMIDATYGHLMRDSHDLAITLLDAGHTTAEEPVSCRVNA